MMPRAPHLHRVGAEPADRLDELFAALSGPIRRSILERLDTDGELLVGELAAPFEISLQAVSRPIQVLVRAGRVRQERSAGPAGAVSTWRHSTTRRSGSAAPSGTGRPASTRPPCRCSGSRSSTANRARATRGEKNDDEPCRDPRRIAPSPAAMGGAAPPDARTAPCGRAGAGRGPSAAAAGRSRTPLRAHGRPARPDRDPRHGRRLPTARCGQTASTSSVTIWRSAPRSS